MRIGLLAFGVVLLVIGGIFYLMPTQSASATTTSATNSGSNTRVSSASISIPLPVTLAVLIIGFVFLVLGAALPNPAVIVRDRTSSTETSSYDVKTRRSETDDGRRHITTRERHVRRQA